MFLHKATPLLKALFPPGLTWKIPTEQAVLYLTFDDGPIPHITEWVLSTLESFQAKATFFCIGDNIRKHPSVFERVQAAGHTLGNHTFHHLKGWKTPPKVYLDNTLQCQQQLALPIGLFRPPYGQITYTQAKLLQQKGYQMLMWDVLSGDFEKNVSPQTCLRKSLIYTQPGSVVVFHDSYKAEKNLRYVLPRYLEHMHHQGYFFKAL
jgi:peptidoglycan/xylan/chitin deacetylase (PgdA/CDA1 family)